MKIFAVFLLLLLTFACQNSVEKKDETKTENTPKTNVEIKTETTPNVSDVIIDVPKLVGKKTNELDAILGKAKTTGEGGAYRLYNLPNEPKGLAIRFLSGRAVNFNLIMSKSFLTSKEALLKGFGIDTGTIPPTRNANEPLSEKYQGMFNGIKFNKVLAKKDEKTNQFIFVFAEIREEDLPKIEKK